MKKMRFILLRIFLLALSASFVAGGRHMILSGEKACFESPAEQNDDLESPDCHFFSLQTDDERLFNKEDFNLHLFDISTPGIINYPDLSPRDFSNPVWQPPKA